MGDSDWSYINDKWGHDSDGMPNFMNDASFYDSYKKPSYKPSANTGGNRTEKEYYENGELKSEKKYYQHKIVSDIEYFENGNKQCELTTLHGKERSYSGWHENGLIAVELDFNSKLEINYDEKGMKRSEGHFSSINNNNFLREGVWTFWTIDDFDRCIWLNTQSFLHDKLEGEACEYDINGRLREKGKYKDDEKHGQWLIYDSNQRIIADHFFKKGKLIVRNPQYE